MDYVAVFKSDTNEIPVCITEWQCRALGSDVVEYGTTIDDFISYCKRITRRHNMTIYVDDLNYWSNYIFTHLFDDGYVWVDDKFDSCTKSMTALINGDNNVYSIDVWFWVAVKNNGKKSSKKIAIYDMCKHISMDLEEAKAKFKINKSDIDTMYDLATMLSNDELLSCTIASGSLKNFKNYIGVDNFNYLFPTVNEGVDEYLRTAYGSGYHYLNKSCINKVLTHGYIIDNNSMYPHILASELLPYGTPKKFEGKYVPNKKYPIYVQRIRITCSLRNGKIPFITIKAPDGMTEIVNSTTNYSPKGIDDITLTVTNMELDLIFKHYVVSDIEYLDGYMFKASRCIFRDWVDFWCGRKIEAENINNLGKRHLCKLIMNTLPGKFATGGNTITNKKPTICEDKSIGYIETNNVAKDRYGRVIVDENTGECKMQSDIKSERVYIPVAIFVIAYGRCRIIKQGQRLQDDKRYRYVYSDTDSLHFLGNDIPSYIDISPTEIGKYKIEFEFEQAKYLNIQQYVCEDREGKKKIIISGLANKTNEIDVENFEYGHKYKSLITESVWGGNRKTFYDFEIQYDIQRLNITKIFKKY